MSMLLNEASTVATQEFLLNVEVNLSTGVQLTVCHESRGARCAMCDVREDIHILYYS